MFHVNVKHWFVWMQRWFFRNRCASHRIYKPRAGGLAVTVAIACFMSLAALYSGMNPMTGCHTAILLSWAGTSKPVYLARCG